jgi:hypothetical protein
MFIAILTHLPLWVYAIFAVLVFFGWRQSRTRVVAPAMTAGIAAGMLSLSIYGVIGNFGLHLLPLAAWAVGMALSMLLGRGLVGPRGLEIADKGVRIPGSWLPFVLMMSIFSAKMGLGIATAMGAGVIREPWFIAASSFTFGLFSGAFAARAITVQAFVRGNRRADAVQLGNA